MISEKLLQCELFKGIELEFLNTLISLEPMVLNVKDYLFHENDISKDMYVLIAGKIEVLKEDEHVSNLIATINPISSIGEMVLLTAETRTASARAAETSKLVEINVEEFQQQIDANNPNALRVIYNIALTLSERLKNTTSLLFELQQLEDEGFKEIANTRKKLMEEILL